MGRSQNIFKTLFWKFPFLELPFLDLSFLKPSYWPPFWFLEFLKIFTNQSLISWFWLGAMGKKSYQTRSRGKRVRVIRKWTHWQPCLPAEPPQNFGEEFVRQRRLESNMKGSEDVGSAGSPHFYLVGDGSNTRKPHFNKWYVVVINWGWRLRTRC